MFTQNIINFFYYYFVPFYFKKIEIEDVSLEHLEINKRVKVNNLILYDHCINFNGLVIPYEYIISYGFQESFYIKFFGKITFYKNHLKMVKDLDNSTIINFKTNNKRLITMMRKNIEYHVKYNIK